MKTIITASLVKKLRSRTGAGFLECKRALVEENGNIESSIDNLRKKGKIHAEKKMNKVTNQGAIFTKIQNNYGVMLELNCETDFVAKDDLFLNLGRDIVLTAAKKEIKDIKEIKNTFEEKRINLILKVSENININRFCFIQGTHLFDYVHALRIGVLLDATYFNKTVLKNIAMHIAASNPQFLDSKNVSDIVFQREYKIQLELAKNLNKPNNILNKIIEGKMNKFVNSISLTGQNFIMDPSRKVKDILIENNLNIKSFIRFELGENFS